MNKHKKTYLLAELRDIYYQRFQGLYHEFKSIAAKWEKVRRTFRDERMLPGIKTPVIDELARYFQAASQKFQNLDEDLESVNPTSLICEGYIGEISRIIADIARMLSLIKVSFYQRTVSLELPYIIAGLPKSMEREWGNEIFIFAADSTIRNYLDQLRMYEQEWDGFVSFYPMFLEHETFSGATCLPLFRRTFHLALTDDMKYFVHGYMSLAHEVGHAACESRYRAINGIGSVALIMFRFLTRFFQHRTWIFEQVRKKVPDEMWQKHCTEKVDCRLRYELQKLSRMRKFDTFLKSVAINKLVGINVFYFIDEILADVVALKIAGPYYLRSMFDYIFKTIVLDEEPRILTDSFSELFARISACAAFASGRGYRWAPSCVQFLDLVKAKAEDSIESLSGLRSEDKVCLSCQARLGFLIGSLLSEYYTEIFHGIFKSDSTFSIDPKATEDISAGRIISDKEPRKILHAYFELFVNARKVNSPTVLFSLANSKC